MINKKSAKDEKDFKIEFNEYYRIKKLTKDKPLNENLRAIRDYKDFSQNTISTFIGVSRKTYSQYEVGTRNISAILLFKLASLYNLPMEVFNGQAEGIEKIMENILKLERSKNGHQK